MFLELNNVQKIVILKVKACLLSLNATYCLALKLFSKPILLNYVLLKLRPHLIFESTPPPSKPANELLRVRGQKKVSKDLPVLPETKWY